jgi:hypothetical protein
MHDNTETKPTAEYSRGHALLYLLPHMGLSFPLSVSHSTSTITLLGLCDFLLAIRFHLFTVQHNDRL